MEPKTKNDFITFESLETESLAMHASVEVEDNIPWITVSIQEGGRGMFTSTFTTTPRTLEEISKKFNEIVQTARKQFEQS